jgi:hypothetical protein
LTSRSEKGILMNKSKVIVKAETLRYWVEEARSVGDKLECLRTEVRALDDRLNEVSNYRAKAQNELNQAIMEDE